MIDRPIAMLVGAFFVACTCAALALPDPGELGAGVKLRILVDKVMHNAAGASSAEWIVAETGEAGFNVYSPRLGFDDYDMVRRVSDWCAAHGIYHMVWMRGTLEAPEGDEAAGRRAVWATGHEERLWSPNSDEFWEWTSRHITEYARISAGSPNLLGVILDYENYSPTAGTGFLYPLSFDDAILERFAAAQGIELPELALDQRAAWLKDQGLYDAFERFQTDHWRERCRALREAVDEHNPRFRFVVYPGPITPFLRKAAAVEWSTEQAPVIFATPETYGRASKFLPQAESLAHSGELAGALIADAGQVGVPFHYLGGIDPVLTGADPEFCGKNALVLAQVGGGYWVFYEGPEYAEDHPEYFRWFAWANEAIERGDLDAWQEPRESEEEWGYDLAAIAATVAAPEVTGEATELPRVFLRGDNLLLVSCQAGREVRIAVRHNSLGRPLSRLYWAARGREGLEVAGGTFGEQQGEISFTPTADGLHFVGVSAGKWGGAYRLLRTNAPVGVYAGQAVRVIFGAERLHFSVPEGLATLSLRVSGGGGAETVRANLYNPSAALAASAQTTQGARQAEIAHEPTQPGTWSVELTQADEGTLEDASLALGEGLPPVVSFVAEHVFAAAP